MKMPAVSLVSLVKVPRPRASLWTSYMRNMFAVAGRQHVGPKYMRAAGKPSSIFMLKFHAPF